MTPDRPIWFRRGARIRNRTSPVTWQGWAIACATVAGIVGSVFVASQLAEVYPVAAIAIGATGAIGSLIGYFVALHRYGDV